MDEECGKLEIVMLPWLAMGHFIPFFELSMRLSQNGHHVSLLATPGMLRRLPLLPPSLSKFVDLISCPLPLTENLPPSVESTHDLPSDNFRPFLIQAYSSFEKHLTNFLNDSSRPGPDWIIYDIFSKEWVCKLAARRGVNCAYLCLTNAAAISFYSDLASRDTDEKYLLAPEWISFPTKVAFRPFEARKFFFWKSKKEVSDDHAEWWGSCAFMAIRTCYEFEPEWLVSLRKFNDGFPIIPVGFLPSSFYDQDEEGETWLRIADWLNKHKPKSVVFVAFGTEVNLTCGQIEEIALGLEQSGLPFIWALREGSPSPGFEERVRGKGLVVKKWVPQARLLAHPSVGGFLTHGGWSSIIEGLMTGVVLVVLPIQFEQGLTARHLEERGFGVEVVRDYEDGSFSGEAIARKLRWAMKEDEGRVLREASRKARDKFGDQKLHDAYLKEFVNFLLMNKKFINEIC